MSPLSVSLVLKVLDGLSMRAVATAENIANAGSPGFRAARVSFEDVLAQSAARGPEAVDALQPRFFTVDDPARGPEVRLDLEMATASSTAMRYAALIDLLGRQLRLDALAASEIR